MLRLSLLTLTVAISAVIVTCPNGAAAENDLPPVMDLLKLQADGNHKDAYDGLRRFVLERKEAPSRDLVKAFDTAVTCLQQLNRVDEIDEFREKTAERTKTIGGCSPGLRVRISRSSIMVS